VSEAHPTVNEAHPIPAVHFDHVWLERDGEAVLENIHFNVARGEFLGIVGPNGAGKTTLLKTLLGLLRPSRGHVEVFGRTPDQREFDAHGIGYVPQRYAVPPRFPAAVADVVLMGRLCCHKHFHRLRAQDKEEVVRTLSLVGLAGFEKRLVSQLSGGEQRRVLLAQALCASTQLLVLDEPTIGLDLPAEHAFYALLRRLQRELSLTVLCVSHDLVALAGQADKLMCINRRMHIHGNPDEVVHSHALREAYSCEFDFIAGELAHHAAPQGPR